MNSKPNYNKLDKKVQKLISFSIEHCPDLLICTEPDGKIIYVNEAAFRLLGYSREDLLFMNMCDIDPDFDASFNSENWKISKAGALSSQKAYYRKKDGSVFPVELTINFMEVEGEKFFCVFVRDITYQKHMEESLRNATNDQQSRFKKRIKELVASNEELARRIEELKQTEEKLKKSESTLKEAQHISRLRNWELNCETEEVELSDEMYHIYGLKKRMMVILWKK